MPNALTWIFLAALLLATGVRLWLARRQIRHVRAHRAEVPPSFAETISLAAHQKAADYTVAKVRLGEVDVLIGAALLLQLFDLLCSLCLGLGESAVGVFPGLREFRCGLLFEAVDLFGVSCLDARYRRGGSGLFIRQFPVVVAACGLKGIFESTDLVAHLLFKLFDLLSV